MTIGSRTSDYEWPAKQPKKRKAPDPKRTGGLFDTSEYPANFSVDTERNDELNQQFTQVSCPRSKPCRGPVQKIALALRLDVRRCEWLPALMINVGRASRIRGLRVDLYL